MQKKKKIFKKNEKIRKTLLCPSGTIRSAGEIYYLNLIFMANKKEKTAKEEKAITLTPEIRDVSIVRFDPEKEVAFASKAAKALTKIIETKPKKVMINNEQYLEFEDWQTIARFFNNTVGTENTRRITDENGAFKGYEADAIVYNANGIKIGSAEASCYIDEKNWSAKPEFQLKSMAQTRACAKALRNIFAWVVVLAGFKTTPAEELNDRDYAGGFEKEPFPSKESPAKKAPAKQQPKKGEPALKCSDCGKMITPAIAGYSQKNYKLMLCMDCQKKYKKSA